MDVGPTNNMAGWWVSLRPGSFYYPNSDTSTIHFRMLV